MNTITYVSSTSAIVLHVNVSCHTQVVSIDTAFQENVVYVNPHIH